VSFLLLWLKFIHHGVIQGCREGEGRPYHRLRVTRMTDILNVFLNSALSHGMTSLLLYSV
uniref:hypothetical protein n=1 Tax=Escherichia coli TaxID=562 RepID=UPI003917371C